MNKIVLVCLLCLFVAGCSSKQQECVYPASYVNIYSDRPLILSDTSQADQILDAHTRSVRQWLDSVQFAEPPTMTGQRTMGIRKSSQPNRTRPPQEQPVPKQPVMDVPDKL